MARKFKPEDLTLVPCNCEPVQSIGGGTAVTEWYEGAKDAARAVKGHVERGYGYWAVHWAGGDAEAQHVVSAVLDGLRWGPGPPQ